MWKSPGERCAMAQDEEAKKIKKLNLAELDFRHGIFNIFYRHLIQTYAVNADQVARVYVARIKYEAKPKKNYS